MNNENPNHLEPTVNNDPREPLTRRYEELRRELEKLERDTAARIDAIREEMSQIIYKLGTAHIERNGS